MKTVKVTYHCDYCKQVVDQDDETVMAIMPGRIGYQDSFMPDSEECVQHYHDYCLAHILTLEFGNDNSVDDQEPAGDEPQMSFEEILSEEPVSKKEHVPSKKEDNRKDLGKLQSLLNAGWSKTKIADEFSVHISTIYNWMKELEGGGRSK